VHGERIVLGDIVARYYESQQFQPQWRDPARLDLLLASLFDCDDDGLEPNDYHVEALQSYRTSCGARKYCRSPSRPASRCSPPTR
jgi:murein L,D-transpeptidase YcbB/YkuD